MTKSKMTKEEIARSSAHRYRAAFSWFTIEETRVIQHALESYIKLGPDSSWPIQLARDLLKGITDDKS
jgi:hypothetical protein